MSPLHVSVAARGPYLRLSAVTLASALANGEGPIHVHYLHPPEAPVDDLEALRAMVEAGAGAIDFHAIAPERVAELPTVSEFTSAMWYRILLPELLGDVDRVLYLDVDTLVLDSLRPLAELDLSGHLVAAVSNVFQHNHVGRPRELGIPPEQAYFNSGVLLMNLAEMRSTGAADAIVECAIDRGLDLEWPDQDALNLVLGPSRLAIEPRWNCMNSVMHFDSATEVLGEGPVREARADPAIRHFEGPGANKPWNPGCTDPLRGRWLEHLATTPWPDLRLGDDPSLGLLRRTLRRLRTARV